MGRGRRDRAEEDEGQVEAASREYLTYDKPEQARRRDKGTSHETASRTEIRSSARIDCRA